MEKLIVGHGKENGNLELHPKMGVMGGGKRTRREEREKERNELRRRGRQDFMGRSTTTAILKILLQEN